MSPVLWVALGALTGFVLGALYVAILAAARNGAPPPAWAHRPCQCVDCVAIYGWPPTMPSAPLRPPVREDQERRRGW